VVTVPRADVLVIGAGLIGSSIALHLRWRGLSVRVLERDRVADGTSARGGGWVAAQSRPPGPHLALALASIAYYPELLDRIGDDCGYLRCGSLVLLEDEEQVRQRRAFVAEQSQLATYDPPVFLDREQLRSLEPAVSDAVFAATYREADGQVDPPRMVRALVAAAKRAGVDVHLGARVTHIDRDGAGWRARTTIGDFSGDVVVNAAGPWASSIARMVDAEIPVDPVAGQMMATPPQEHFVRCVIGAYKDQRRSNSVPARDVRQAWDGRIWVGTTMRPGSWDATVTREDTTLILSSLEALFPGLRGAVIEEAWAGVRPNPRDGLPIYGKLDDVPGHFVAVPMAGICESAIAGKAMAELITTGASATPLDAFSPRRFNATPLAV
jgi:sarcosine oxidase subunit beta